MKQKILSFFVFAMAMLISITANAKVEKFATATPQKVQTEMFLPLKMTQLVKGQPQKMAKQNVGRVEQKTLLGKKVKANHQQVAPVKFASKKAPKTAGANYDVAGVDWYYDDYYYDVYVYSEDATYIFELTENLQYGKDYTYADMVPEWVCTLDAEGYPDVTATDATLNVSKDEAGMVHIVATMVLNGDTYNLKFDEKPFVPSGVKINLDGTELEGQYMSYYGMYVYFAKVGENDIQLAFDATAEQDIFTADQLIADYCMYASSDYSMFVEFVKAASDFTVTKTATTKTLSGSVYAKNGDEYVLNLVCEIPAPRDMNINVTDATLTDRTAAGYWVIDGQTADKNNAISLYFIGKEFEGTFTDVNSFDSDYTYVSDKSSGSNVYYDSPSAINITSAIVGDSLCIDGTMTVTSSAGAIANVTMHISTPYQQQSQSDWTEWEDFAPAGSNDAVWDLAAWAKEKSAVKCFVRTSTADATKKQIKVAGYGAGILTVEGVDILINWNTTTNDVRIPIQLTGYYNSSMKEDVVFGDVASIMGEQFASSYPSTYDPEQGKFSFNVLYSVPSVITTGNGFGLGVETMLRSKGFIKGINLGGWMSQCDYSQERLDNFITESDFEKIASWGFDHVRLPIDYNIIQNDDGTPIEDGYARIDNAIALSRKYGLKIILDIHKTAGFSFDSGENEEGFFDNEMYQERFYLIWTEFARRYGSQTDDIVFELLNEVTDEQFIEKWNEIIRICMKRIRSIAPDVVVLVGSYHNNSADTVQYLESPYDRNVVYNFHCYEPLKFTHQGATWTSQINPDERLSFAESGTTAEYFEKLFSTAIEKAKVNCASLYCGEYGVIDIADAADSLEWFKVIHSIFEKYGISRSVWSYKEMDFGIADKKYDSIREELLKYL